MMKHTLKILGCILLMFALVGCSTILEPTSPEDSLLIGKLTMQSQGWDDFHNASVNGVVKGSISMEIENVDTKEYYATSTSSDGYFFKINPKSGYYIIKRLAYQNTSSEARSTLHWEPNLKLKYLQVEPGKVINLGSLTWVAVKGQKSSVSQSESPEFLQTLYAANFPKSLWNQREWVHVKLFE